MSSVLTAPTLVLNKCRMAIGIDTVQDAITKVCKGNAEIIDPADYQEYTWEEWTLFTPREGEDVVRAAHGPVRAPDVIVLTNYDSVHSRTVRFQPAKPFRTGQEYLPILRQEVQVGGFIHRPRLSAVPGWPLYLGQLRPGVPQM
jgi:hypothetical protein